MFFFFFFFFFIYIYVYTELPNNGVAMGERK
jgi:hypothetical protein